MSYKQKFEISHSLVGKWPSKNKGARDASVGLSNNQRWSPQGRPWPRGHIFKSLVLALASKPQVLLENCPVLGSRIALFFEWLKFCRSAEECFSRPLFLEIDGKKILRPFFLGKHLHLCPWSLALASSIPVLGLEPSVLDSTSANNCNCRIRGQADALPRQATFFHFKTLQNLRQLKKTTQRRLAKMESSTFCNQLPSVRACSSVRSFSISFGAFRLPIFSIVLNFFELMQILH